MNILEIGTQKTKLNVTKRWMYGIEWNNFRLKFGVCKSGVFSSWGGGGGEKSRYKIFRMFLCCLRKS